MNKPQRVAARCAVHNLTYNQRQDEKQKQEMILNEHKVILVVVPPLSTIMTFLMLGGIPIEQVAFVLFVVMLNAAWIVFLQWAISGVTYTTEQREFK